MEIFPVISVAENPVYQRKIAVVRKLREYCQGTVSVVPAVSPPVHTIPEFCGGIGGARYYLNRYPDTMKKMLKAFIQTEPQLVNAYIEMGADGFSSVTRYSDGDILSEGELKRFCRPFDKRLLTCAKGHTWFNMAHVHEARNFYMEKFDSYDVQAISWKNTPGTMPGRERSTVEKIREITDKILIAGTGQSTDYYGTREEARERFRKRLETAARESDDGRSIFAPGCSLPLGIDLEHVHLLRGAMDEYNEKL